LHKYKAAAKTEFYKIDPNYGLVPVGLQNTFSVSEVSYQDYSCYKIRMELSDDLYQEKLQVEGQINSVREAGARPLQKIVKSLGMSKKLTAGDPKNKVAYLYEFIIDKESKVIWNQIAYLKSGAKLYEFKYTKIEINIPLSDDLFKISKGVKQLTAETLLDLYKIQTGI
jgi:hypothetical protein